MAGGGCYATPLREPTPLPGREKSGVGGTGIMTSETGSFQGASGRQPALSSGGGGPLAGATQGLEYV